MGFEVEVIDILYHLESFLKVSKIYTAPSLPVCLRGETGVLIAVLEVTNLRKDRTIRHETNQTIDLCSMTSMLWPGHPIKTYCH